MVDAYLTNVMSSINQKKKKGGEKNMKKEGDMMDLIPCAFEEIQQRVRHKIEFTAGNELTKDMAVA